jgi:hypothetical protein
MPPISSFADEQLAARAVALDARRGEEQIVNVHSSGNRRGQPRSLSDLRPTFGLYGQQVSAAGSTAEVSFGVEHTLSSP